MFVIFYHGKNMFNEAASVVSAFHCPTYISLTYTDLYTIHLSQNQPLPTASTFRNISCFHLEFDPVKCKFNPHICFFTIGSNLHQHFLCFFVKTCNNFHWSYGSKPLISHDWSTYPLPKRTTLSLRNNGKRKAFSKGNLWFS